MSTNEDQPSLLAKLRKLSARIVGTQAKFDLPKGHKDRYETYGGAATLQKDRTKRAALQAQLDPMRIIAWGVSCRDCRYFADVDSPLCWGSPAKTPVPTSHERSNSGTCGPEASLFKTARIDA